MAVPPNHRNRTSWDPLPPHLDPRGRHERTAQASAARTGRRASVWTGRVLGAALSAFLLVVAGLAWKTYRNFDSGLNRLSIQTGVQPAANGTKPVDIDGKDQNILIVGNDDRSDETDAEVKELHTGRDGGSLATDTMMLVHVPADGAKATLVSFPRDSYVAIPGYGMNKINAAFAEAYTHTKGALDDKRAAGANLLVRTISNLTGLTIDHFVQVDLIGFVRISDAIGGVSVNLCNAVDDTVAHNKAIGSDGGSGLVLSKGKHTISGVTALEFVRQRHGLPNGDLDRTARQRYFLTAAFRKVASAGTLLNPGRLNSLLSAVDKSVYVDKSFSLKNLALQLTSLSADNITGKAIPFTKFEDVSGVGSVEILDPAKVKTFVNTLIGDATSALTKAPLVAPSTVSVAVRNWGTINGAAAKNTATLVQAGFQAVVDTTGGSQAGTTIQYPSNMESQAKTLARYIPGATLQPGKVAKLTLTLGADGISARASVPTTSTSTAAKASPTTKPKAIDASCIN